MGGRTKNRVSAVALPALARSPAPIGANAGMPGAAAAGAVSGLPPIAEARGLIGGGATVVQLGGTDNGPIEAALPNPPDTAPPRPPSPLMPPSGSASPAPSPPLAASPNASPAAPAPNKLVKAPNVLLGMKNPDAPDITVEKG